MGSRLMEESGSWDGVRAVRFAMKLLATLVLLGHIMLWIMMPTQTFFRGWLISIHALINPTYFGKLGANTLIYTFPVLFIATLGCLHLHLGSKNHEHDTKSVSKNWYLDSWRRPALTKGPLGIVSWIQLSFFAMFVALLLWFFFSFERFFSADLAQSAARRGIFVWQARISSTGYVLGLVGNVCLAFLFFPVSRGSSVLQLFGLTSESSIKYHIWIGHITMFLFTAHGLLFIVAWVCENRMFKLLEWNTIRVSNVAGEISLLAGLAMWVTCFPRIRRKLFELFFYTHYLYIIFMVFYVFHVGFPYACIAIGGFYLFVIDRYLRFLQSQQRIQLVSARILPCQVLELNFSKSPALSYNPTSVLFVNVPLISKLQWHPFTISSSSNLDPEKLSIVIKTEGTWSSKLYQNLSAASPMDRLEVALEGPYGPASTDFLRHEMLVMVSGGSGITPYISIIRELLFVASTSSIKTPRILLVCAFKKSQDLAMLDLILPPSGTATSFDISHLQLQIEAYVTRETEPTLDIPKPVQTLCFKPNALDSPMAAVLGPNTWLWLGAIIGSSFIIFLVLVAVLTQYYIYPIDHNTDNIYSNTSRSAFYMLFMCVSIAATSSAAFLWNKKHNAKETRQIKNIVGPTPEGSSWSSNADRELESLPHQSFKEATNVNYGARPNLKRILLDIEESSVGVFASGPRSLRQDVAKICASGLADNLVHFESISFSW